MLNNSWFSGSFGDEKNTNTLFRDLILGALGAVMLSLIILIFHINPPKENDAEKERARGNIRVEVIWPQEMNVDIDLWVKAPGDFPVGYSNLNGMVFNLVRDDLGNYADLSEMNYEIAFSRGIPPGEYVINLHWFSNTQGVISVPVKVLISMRKDDSENTDKSSEKVLNKGVTLTSPKQEITVIRFTIDDNGDIDRSSFSTIRKRIRAKDEP